MTANASPRGPLVGLRVLDVDGTKWVAWNLESGHEVRARYSALGEQRADAFSPVASARALTDFLARRFGLDA